MGRWTIGVARVAMSMGLLFLLGHAGAQATPSTDDVRSRLGGVRVPFIANEGQVDPRVAYYAPTFAGTLFVTRQGELVHALPSPAAPTRETRSSPKLGWNLTETFVGGRARPVGTDRSRTGVSVFHGADPTRWRAELATYEQVSLGEVWSGIDVSLAARGGSIEKLFTVKPGARVDRIRIRVGGARALSVDSGGALVAETGLGAVTLSAPIAYQPHAGGRRTIAVTYERRGHEYGFTVARYDRSLPLVIDPLLQATYLGGSDFDEATALAIHPTTGDLYVAGTTASTNFPGTTGGAQPAKAGSADAFVARLNRALTALAQATYLGGSGPDQATALAIHPTTGNVYVAGHTSSANFPGTTGGAQPANGGGPDDAFVARLNSTLTTLTQASYLGGSGLDEFPALAIHPTTGDVYVAGRTSSTNFPRTTGGAQPANAGTQDAFVARLNSALTTLTQATYLGGSEGDQPHALAIHPTSGDVYVAGHTTSANFPRTTGGAQPIYAGNFDAFAARLDSALTTLTQATYLGGSGFDVATALAIHPTTGDVYVAGSTGSPNFPATTGRAQPAYAGVNNDAFVARLNSALTTLTQATYLGGSDTDVGTALAIHPATGDVYVAGWTDSNNFPGTTGGAQPAKAGRDDAFAARLNSGLTTLTQATYLGGSDIDQANGLAIHPTTGDVYVAGFTMSTNFPGTTGGAQPANAGVVDAFVARLTPSLALVDAVPTVPTLSEWVRILLLVLLVASGVLALRRRRVAG